MTKEQYQSTVVGKLTGAREIAVMCSVLPQKKDAKQLEIDRLSCFEPLHVFGRTAVYRTICTVVREISRAMMGSYPLNWYDQ